MLAALPSYHSWWHVAVCDTQVSCDISVSTVRLIFVFVWKQHQKSYGVSERIGFSMHWETVCLVQKWVFYLLLLFLSKMAYVELLAAIVICNVVFAVFSSCPPVNNMNSDDCLEDKREDFWTVLCCIVYDNNSDMNTFMSTSYSHMLI